MSYFDGPDFAADRQAAAQWAAEILQAGDALILDTETTGLSGDVEVVQLAVLALSGGVLLDTYVLPERPIPAAATRVHGITDLLVQGAPRFPVACEQLRTVVGGRQVLIYNADYDRGVILGLCLRQGIAAKGLLDNVQCVMERYAAFYGDWNDRWGSYRWQKLPSAEHGALADCRAVLALLNEMAGAAAVAEAVG